MKAYKKKLILPTYELGKPEINPVFFEKRVYQGSSGKVYPVPFIDKVFDHKVDKQYEAAILENEYLRMVLLPEIGGRIFEAQDKTNNNYDFFYKQEVIKPALVGLAGPWISGGVEFNWPQHHRPGTYLPTDVHIEEEADGARTVWMSEYEPMNRLKGMHGIRIRPNSSLIELRGRLFNRTPLTQTFLWWANVAVEVHKDYQSFFPPDVHYVADHAVRAQSSFPTAENDYYGITYHNRQGKNDLRNYNNIPVPTSYMVCDTNYDFFGGYDFKADGGFVHVANRHIAPGKKQWTWGNEEFGRAWDRELTDEGGPYFELMAGVFTDNQPDFTYLQPYETKTFSQFWWGFKNLGPVQNADKDLAIRLEIEPGNLLDFGVAASQPFENLTVVLTIKGEKKVFENISVSPDNPWKQPKLKIVSGEENGISLTVFNKKGKTLLSYTHVEIDKTRNRKVAIEPEQPEKVVSANELELIGEHLELYRHPTRYPEAYWEEAIQRDPSSYKSYIALGRAALKNGKFIVAEEKLRSAIDIMTNYHPNPASGEAHYFCGLTCSLQGKKDEAYKLFYKSIWNYEWRSAGYYQLATIDCLRGNFETALEHIEASLDTNRQNNKAYILKAIIKKRQVKKQEAIVILENLLKTDVLDQWANFELSLLNEDTFDFLQSSRNDAQTIIDIAFDYSEAGFYSEALQLIELHQKKGVEDGVMPNPMGQSLVTTLISAWLQDKLGNKTRALEILESTKGNSHDYVFPSRLNEQLVFEWAAKHSNSTVIHFGLGNYYYNLKRHEDAILVWEEAVANGCSYATLYRNLGIALWNTRGEGERARENFAKAVALSPEDMRIQFEFDQLKKKLNDSPAKRLKYLEQLGDRVTNRDDLCVEFAALLNFEQRYQKAIDLLEGRNFHPWEGGEGQVLKQYTHACLRLGQKALVDGNPKLALDFFNKSFETPDNLGEKYHPLQAIAHINYWKGMAYKALNKLEEANQCFKASSEEEGDFIDMAVSAYSELTYYSALSFIELGKSDEAKQLLQGLKKHSEEKLNEEVRIDYFATSLPLLLVFDEDLQKRNKCDSKFLLALADLGLGDKISVNKLLHEVIEMNTMHMLANDFLSELNFKL